MRTAAEVLGFCRKESAHESKNWTGRCQEFTRTAFGVGGLYPSATSAWLHTNKRHTDRQPPPAVPVYWTGGSKGFGHAAVSAGDGFVFSTDFPRGGQVGRVSIGQINRDWSSLRFQGWAEDTNEVVVWRPPSTLVDASAATLAMRRGSAVTHGSLIKRELAALLDDRSMNMQSDVWGANAKRAARHLQERWYGRGDGILGYQSIRRLGLRRHSWMTKA